MWLNQFTLLRGFPPGTQVFLTPLTHDKRQKGEHAHQGTWDMQASLRLPVSEKAELQGPSSYKASFLGSFKTLQHIFINTQQRNTDSESPNWASEGRGPSRVLNNKEEGHTFCTFPVRPGDIWTVGAIFTLWVGLGREAGSVTEIHRLPRRRSSQQTREVLCPCPCRSGDHPQWQNLLMLMFLSYLTKAISQVMQNKSSSLSL